MYLKLTVLLITVLVLSCAHSHSKSEIEAAMHKYDSLIQSMDAAAIASMFTSGGKLGDVAQGRDSIKKFLSSFTNVKVLSQSSKTKSIEINGDSATQTGVYFQNDLVNKKDTAHLKGNYTTKWKYLQNEGWKIDKITTQPTQ